VSEQNETNVSDVEVKFPFVRPEEGVFQVYSNFIDAAWTLFDVTLRFAQIVPTHAGAPSFVASLTIQRLG